MINKLMHFNIMKNKGISISEWIIFMFLLFFFLITILQNCKHLIFSLYEIIDSHFWNLALNFCSIIEKLFEFSSNITFFFKFFFFLIHFFTLIIILLLSPFVNFCKVQCRYWLLFEFLSVTRLLALFSFTHRLKDHS